MSKEKGLELVRCAEINLDNLIKMTLLSMHPFALIVKEQLSEGIKELEEDE